MAHGAKSTENLPKKTRQAHNNKVPPDAPRRNLSSFVMFANVRRKELKERFPDLSFPEIQSVISDEWAKMDDDNKNPWKQAMTDDKERYKREMELYRKYGPHWVWVVGHKMRLGLGLTDEDCTQLRWDVPSAPRSDPGVSSRLPQSRNELDGKLDSRGSSYGLGGSGEPLTGSTSSVIPRHDSSSAELLAPGPFLDPQIYAEAVSAAKPSRSKSLDIPNRNQHDDNQSATQDELSYGWSPEWPHGLPSGETPCPSYIIDWGFGFDPEWQDSYPWGD
ncbi:hypothetical protein ABW21_db0208191 [Orbilia brochopaga]|nr:hypothetical protein ABW21_db0208191 [Drechslerella brochopaga]